VSASRSRPSAPRTTGRRSTSSRGCCVGNTTWKEADASRKLKLFSLLVEVNFISNPAFDAFVIDVYRQPSGHFADPGDQRAAKQMFLNEVHAGRINRRLRDLVIWAYREEPDDLAVHAASTLLKSRWERGRPVKETYDLLLSDPPHTASTHPATHRLILSEIVHDERAMDRDTVRRSRPARSSGEEFHTEKK
jgi:hypothetical protein